MSQGRTIRVVLAALLAGLGLALGTACQPTEWRTAEGALATGRLNDQREPVTGCVYQLYVPYTYDPRRAYALVITAQGTFPFDDPSRQRETWVVHAELHDMIICAPALEGATGLLPIPADRPAPALVRDEKAVLGMIEQLASRYNVNRDAIMITGWSGGAYPAQFVGLRHPDLFRCVVGRAANFNEHIVTDDEARRARHMHVYAWYSELDLPGFDVLVTQTNLWYTAHGFLNLKVERRPGLHSPSPGEATRYFMNLVHHWPVVRVKASPTRGPAPLTVALAADIRDPDAPDGAVESVLWNFGDGETMVGRTVSHAYASPGTYNVFVRVRDRDGHDEFAQDWIEVEGAAAPAESPKAVTAAPAASAPSAAPAQAPAAPAPAPPE